MSLRHKRIMTTITALVIVLGLSLHLSRRLSTEVNPVSSENGTLIFDGALAEDILSEGESLLTIEYANVKDNGEGKWPPHGPYGSIHAVIYSPEQPPEAPWRSDFELYRTMLYGPHRTIGNLFEWLDNEELTYTNYALYDWDLYTSDQVVIRFYESDPGPGREHDDLLTATVSKQETLTQEVTMHSDKMIICVRTQVLQNLIENPIK